jgi:hypothetical protein
MINQQHPIFPPPELVHNWATWRNATDEKSFWQRMSTQAAQWGADQELEACCQFLRSDLLSDGTVERLCNARRPKQLSLKEQALADLKQIGSHYIGPNCSERIVNIRRALETLSDD